MGSCDKEKTFEILDTFYDLGGNFVDTANAYQGGQSEEWIGEWMETRGRRDEMVLSTKYAMGYMGGQPVQQSNFGGTGTKSMRLAVDNSLKLLRTSYIDLVYTHHCFIPLLLSFSFPFCLAANDANSSMSTCGISPLRFRN